MHPEKIEVEKIQNGRLSAIIHLDRPDIVVAQDIYTITIKQIVRPGEDVDDGRQSAIIHFHMAAIW